MALFENVTEVLFEKTAGPWILGIGAVLAAPVVLPVFRPVAKQMIKGGLFVTDKAREAFSDTAERWGDLIAEARAEMEKPAGEEVVEAEVHHEG